MKLLVKKISIFVILIYLFLPLSVLGQGVYESFQGTYKAEILEVLNEEEKTIGFGDSISLYRELELVLLEGPNQGQNIFIESDYPELEKGDKVFVNHNVYLDDSEVYAITNIDRTSGVYFFVFLFVLAIILFGGWQGLRSLVSLVFSFLAIFYILLPGILNGWNPLISSFIVASLILFGAIFFTHGFNRESLVAYLGTMFSIFLTSLLAWYAVGSMKLSGFVDDSSIFLNINTGGGLDFSGLLLGAIIIGILGVLDDIAVTQSAVVSELYDSNKNASKKTIYKRAIRVGKEHVGALVNTLVLAYTGTALPLLLLFYNFNYEFSSVINLEIFSTEIIRTIVGSIGLIMTVPIVTFLAVFTLKDYKKNPNSKKSHIHSH